MEGERRLATIAGVQAPAAVGELWFVAYPLIKGLRLREAEGRPLAPVHPRKEWS
jgi:hypothetical protein